VFYYVNLIKIIFFIFYLIYIHIYIYYFGFINEKKK
jgi:hypothetical protein